MNLEKLISRDSDLISNIINKYLPQETAENKRVVEAMKYAMLSSGKRVRPCIMLESYKMFSPLPVDERLEGFMYAIEAVHCYSLIHDDLPAMDDDEERRGLPCTHIKFDEATAILAGDALLNHAMEVAVSMLNLKPDDGRAAKAMSILFGKAGVYGMVGGQSMDLYYSNREVNEKQLTKMYELKTCALIEASIMIGAVFADMSPQLFGEINRFGFLIGMIFQITDDILDYEEDSEIHKNTIATVFGIETAKEMVRECREEALELFEFLALEDKSFFGDFIEALTERTR